MNARTIKLLNQLLVPTFLTLLSFFKGFTKVCSTNSDIKISCRKPEVSYRIVCTLCSLDEIGAAYEGETGKCLFVRGKWHIKEFKDEIRTNEMVIHNQKYHQVQRSFTLKWKLCEHFRKPWTDRLRRLSELRIHSLTS